AWMAVFVLTLGIRPTGFGAQSVLWALCLAVFCTLLGHTMLNVSLKYFKAPTVSAVMLVTVATAPLVVLAVLGDAPTAYTLLGGCIILVGLVWYLTVEHREAKAAQKAAQPEPTAANGSGNAAPEDEEKDTVQAL
ncbi:MAG TPA: DMT family transporter, partial [Candidatus Limiplasma sp.]|nr:DMT family transporter [Candidatus Limiplasma sp.]